MLAASSKLAAPAQVLVVVVVASGFAPDTRPPRPACSARAQILQIDIDSPCSLVNLRAGALILKVEGKPLDKPLPDRLQQKDLAGKHIVQLEVRRPPSVRGSQFHADL